MAEIVLKQVSKVYADGTTAVDAVDLAVADGEFMVLVGPSGCGKTTALRMIAGLEDISRGELRIDGRLVNAVPSRDRDVAMVFQSYALYPHLDVFENIAFGLRLRKVPRAEVDRRVRQVSGVLGLAEHLGRKPGALSGGQRQRVAMGRAMVREPRAFLMDEPLSNLDTKLRVQMRAEIARTTRQMGVTTIYVTHDQTEAMTLGNRTAVLKRGVLQQVAPPQELYDRPANLFVAGFIGSPAMNLLTGRLIRDDEGWAFRLGEQRLPVPNSLLAARPALAGYRDELVAVGIRPEDLSTQGPHTLRVTVDLTEALGSDLLVHARIDAPAVVTEDTRELDRDSGAAELSPTVSGPSGAEIVARLDPRTPIREGEAADLAVDVARLHVFDVATGTSIW